MQNILLVFEVLLGLGVVVTIFMQPSKSDALSGLIQGSTKIHSFQKTNQELKKLILVRLTVMFMALFAINYNCIKFNKIINLSYFI